MKTTANYQPTRLNGNAQRANDRAANANGNALTARTYRDFAIGCEQTVSDWRKVMVGSPVLLLTISFVILATAEILYSWEMYREFLAAFFGDPHWSIVLLLGLVIVFAAAYVSHLLSKSISSNLFDLEVYNYKHITKQGTILDEEAVEYISADKKKDLIWGIVGFILVLAVVGLISWQRSVLMTDATGEGDYSLIQKVFPIIIVLLEIFTGIYLGQYLFPQWVKLYKKGRAWAKYNKHLNICSREDRLVKVLLEQANLNGETYITSKQMADSMYRVLYRTENNIHYVDEIYQKQLTLTVVGNDNRPVENAQVVGFLPSQSVIGGVSNAHGNVYLFWETADLHIEQLVINGIIKEGIFKENSNIVISIAEQLRLNS
jgi:hypothetical protein